MNTSLKTPLILHAFHAFSELISWDTFFKFISWITRVKSAQTTLHQNALQDFCQDSFAFETPLFIWAWIAIGLIKKCAPIWHKFPSVDKEWALTGLNLMTGSITISPATGVPIKKETIYGTQKNTRPLQTKCGLAHWQNNQRATPLPKHWHRLPPRSRTVLKQTNGTTQTSTNI